MTGDSTVYLFDVDNTLLDNDAVADDLRRHLTEQFGGDRQQRYWDEFERLRAELGYADYLGALQRFRVAYPHDVHMLEMSDWLIDYPFAERLYPRALDVVGHVRDRGRPVILTDGDVVFQPRKIERSGLRAAVADRVFVFVHKEAMIDVVAHHLPARRYVMVDDKERVLAAMKAVWGERLVTVFPRQGHYAHDPANAGRYPPADRSVERIGDLLAVDLDTLLRGTLKEKP